jgi:hypothetical protein
VVKRQPALRKLTWEMRQRDMVPLRTRCTTKREEEFTESPLDSGLRRLASDASQGCVCRTRSERPCCRPPGITRRDRGRPGKWKKQVCDSQEKQKRKWNRQERKSRLRRRQRQSTRCAFRLFRRANWKVNNLDTNLGSTLEQGEPANVLGAIRGEPGNVDGFDSARSGKRTLGECDPVRKKLTQ